MKKYDLAVITLLLLFLLASGGVAAQFTALNGRKVTAAALDSFLRQQMDSIGMPGLQIAIINEGKIVCHRSVGEANIDTKTPVDDQSIFEAASMSKPVFAYLVMKMVDKGLINLDTPLCSYMPYPDIADERYKLITARMVLTHRSGFPNWRYYNQNNIPDTALHVKYGQLFLKFTPGTQYSYSGEGFVYLAKVVAFLNHRTLQSLEPLYESEVAVPLGMEHAWFTGNDYIARHKVAGHINGKVHFHHDTPPGGTSWPNSSPDWDSSYFNPAASLHTDAISYAHFVINWMLGNGLSKTSLAEMLRPQYHWQPKDSSKSEGLGIFMSPSPYGIVYQHGGDNLNFQSDFAWYPAQKAGYVILTNCDKRDAFEKQLKEFFTNGK
jgi:CubicO group peptidase (beta-lactamase class C family)